MKIQGIEISNEDANTLRQIKLDRQTVRGWHPGDDSPFQLYSGYTVRDARCHMQRIVEGIHSKYQIPLPGYTPAAIERDRKQRAAKQLRQQTRESKVQAKFPRLGDAMDVIYASESVLRTRTGRGYFNSKPDPRKVQAHKQAKLRLQRTLKRTGFRTVSEACAVRKQANTYRGLFRR